MLDVRPWSYTMALILRPKRRVSYPAICYNKRALNVSQHAQGSSHRITCQGGHVMSTAESSMLSPAMKCCLKCQECKPVQAFHRSHSATDGYQSWCMACSRALRIAQRDQRRIERAAQMPQYPEGMKRCSKCHEIKLYKDFPVCKKGRDGYVSECHACRKIYYDNNKESIQASRKQHRLKNLGKYKLRNKQYHQEHRDKRLTYLAAWKRNNPGYWMKYYRANTEKFKMKMASARARRKHAPINDLTQEQWEFLKRQFHYACAYCGKKSRRLTKDHITPLVKGGGHTLSNIVPACGSCNSKKRDRAPLKPVQPFFLTPG